MLGITRRSVGFHQGVGRGAVLFRGDMRAMRIRFPGGRPSPLFPGES
ncbi:hypothetical protein [Alkalilimnicola sp. S0819]|nr:hypothetical protein [Alkalilimnicola sp. S0819]